MVHAFAACARLATMAEGSDLHGTSVHFCDEESGATATGLVCHDSHPGGLGYAAKAFEHADPILDAAIALVESCGCRRSCPACVGSYARDRRLVCWALRSLRQATALPAGLTAGPSPRTPAPPVVAPLPPAVPGVPWDEITARWAEVLRAVRGAFGAELLARLPPPACRGDRLVLRAQSAGIAGWLAEEETARRLRATLDRVVAAPAGWRLLVEVDAEAQAQALARAIKLRRRHDDLTGGAPDTERQADATLAGGYVFSGGAREGGEPRS
jgi:DEAD/DEAH box helicase domain-containing protein